MMPSEGCLSTRGHTARLHLNECDSVIGSGENPNEAVNTSAPSGPRTTRRPTPVPDDAVKKQSEVG